MNNKKIFLNEDMIESAYEQKLRQLHYQLNSDTKNKAREKKHKIIKKNSLAFK